jgi:tripartite-type tricarboxylate transporter receptor subunit TctC
VHAGTPKEIVKALNQEIVAIINMPEIRERFADLGFDLIGNTPEQFQAFIEAEVAKWGKVVRDANIYAD